MGYANGLCPVRNILNSSTKKKQVVRKDSERHIQWFRFARKTDDVYLGTRGGLAV